MVIEKVMKCQFMADGYVDYILMYFNYIERSFQLIS